MATPQCNPKTENEPLEDCCQTLRPNLTQDLKFDEIRFCCIFPMALRGRLQSELSLKRGATSALEATVVTLEPLPQ